MPDLPLAQQIFLAGVVSAFAAFIAIVGGTHIYVNLPSTRRDQASR